MRFQTPPTPRPQDWGFHFEEVRRFARVWLNGRLIGHSDDGYVPFDVPAKGLKPAGQDNLLVVRVDNRKTLRTFREGWWNWGGIIRPVSLVPRGEAQLSDLGLLSRLKYRAAWSARVTVVGTVKNRTTAPIAPQVAVKLTSPTGDVSQKTATLPQLAPGASEPVSFDMPVTGTPALWDPVHPNLYDALVQTRADGTPRRSTACGSACARSRSTTASST